MIEFIVVIHYNGSTRTARSVMANSSQEAANTTAADFNSFSGVTITVYDPLEGQRFSTATLAIPEKKVMSKR